MALQSAWMREVWAAETERVVEQQVAAAAAAAEARGKAAGIAEGKAEGKAEFLVRVLHTRFVGVTRELEARVHGIESDTLLDELLDAALRCRSLAMFVRKLPP